MDPALLDLLQRQQRDGFPDLAGTEVAATIPVSECLINDLIARLVSSGGRVREVRVRAEEGNRVTAAVRLSVSFLPAISVRLAIEDQPELPGRPTLGLKLVETSGLLAKAASLFSALPALPPGIAIDGDRIRIDIRRVLAERNMVEWLEYVTDLRVTTRAAAIVLDVHARIRPSPRWDSTS
jgi:hypothetical protein